MIKVKRIKISYQMIKKMIDFLRGEQPTSETVKLSKSISGWKTNGSQRLPDSKR